MHGLFITASDTGVGKTWCATRLIHAARQRGLAVQARKPVESGCADGRDGLIAADGEQLARAADSAPHRQVTPLRFRLAAAPDEAARAEGRSLRLDELEQAVRAGLDPDDFVIVEGAGGFYSPLAEDGLNADLARRLGLPLVIVVADRLGAINQALLTCRAARDEGLPLAALILNETLPGEARAQHLEALRQRVGVDVLHCPHGGEPDSYPPSLFA